MKFTKPIITAAAAVGISVAMAATASAYSTVGKFGTYERLYDAGGAVVTAWTVDNLKPSTDRIPAYPLHGTLWEATATIEAVRGTVTPLIPNLNARADNGQNYQALWEPGHPFEIVTASGTAECRRATARDWATAIGGISAKARQGWPTSRTVKGPPTRRRPLRCIAAQRSVLNSMAR